MSNNFQDIVSGSGRSIRRIPVSDRNNRVRKSANHTDSEGILGRSGSNGYNHRRKNSKFGLWFVAILSLVILYFVFSIFFSGAKIEITPKQETVFIDGEFNAFREPQSGELQYEIMTIEKSLSKEIPATGEEFVEEKASGQIIVYNNYSNTSQKLIANTRFETADGLIYRIKDAVVVPGMKTIGGETVPGNLEVTVYADKPGAKYNKDLLDFTIPGLKGDPRYSKFYARSKTAIAGGASGVKKVASPDDLAVASKELDSKLRMEILEEALSVKPEGFELLNDSYVIDTTLSTSNSNNGNVLITQKALLRGVIFKENDLAKFIAHNTIALYKNSDEVKIHNLDSLRLTINESEKASIEGRESISFKLEGSAKIVWVFDKKSLISDLSGQSKSDALAIMARYPSIESAEVVVRPFWKRSITDNEEKIELRTIIEK